jgi:hypothetical protein
MRAQENVDAKAVAGVGVGILLGRLLDVCSQVHQTEFIGGQYRDAAREPPAAGLSGQISNTESQ